MTKFWEGPKSAPPNSPSTIKVIQDFMKSMSAILLVILVVVFGTISYHFWPSFTIGVLFGWLANKICVHDFKMIEQDITVVDDDGVKNYFLDGCRKCGKVRFKKYAQLGD